jgi:hypothetical protein
MSLMVLLRVLFLSLSIILYAGAPSFAGKHCGGQGDWRSNLVPDYWPPKGFKAGWVPGGGTIKKVPVYKSCIKHDDCYDRRGANQKECDLQFRADMRAQCDSVYKNLLQAAHLEACLGAAQGYYKAVATYGGPAFAAAQAKHGGKQAKASGAKEASETSKDRSQAEASARKKPREKAEAKASGDSNPLKWRLWGRLEGVGGLAAMHGKIYAYKPAASEVLTSSTKKCAWKSLGDAPKGKVLAAGQGNLYLTGVGDGEIWLMRPGTKPWHSLGSAPAAKALTICGGKMICWFNPGGLLQASSPWSLKWREMGQAENVLSLAGDGGKLYRLTGPGLEISWSRKGKPPWQTLGRAKAGGPLAADRRMLYLALPETGEIYTAPAR